MHKPNLTAPLFLTSLLLMVNMTQGAAQTTVTQSLDESEISPGSLDTPQNSRTIPVSPGWPNLSPTSSDTFIPSSPLSQSFPLQEIGYLLGPGDVIRLDIFDVPEYSGDYAVLADGTVGLPLVGATNIGGMTLEQASETISRTFSPFLRRPLVTISLQQVRPVQVAIAGQVNHPGSYTLESLTSLSEALQQAGGTTPSADLRQVEVRRVLPLGQSGEHVITLSLADLINSGDMENDLLLRPGDSIFIPAVQDINLAETQRFSLATVASNSDVPIRIAVVGEVKAPGPHILERNIKTVATAIQNAGGITEQADIRNIEVRRRGPTGETRKIAVDFWQLLKEGDLSQDLPLQNGDTILVPTATALTPEEMTTLAATTFSPQTITVNVVGEVAGPGAIAVKPNTPLNQAILAAGGFTNRAKKGSVELVRLNPNGSVTRRSVEIDLSQGLDLQTNPPLQEFDTIIVGRSGLAAFSDTVGTILSPVTTGFGIFNLLF